MNTETKHVRSAALAFAVCAGLVLAFFGLARLLPFADDAIRYTQEGIRGCRSKADVRDRFGEPDHVYRTDSAPADYYVDGYSFRERPITDEVWIHVQGHAICYTWFDAAGHVEDWFVGGS